MNKLIVECVHYIPDDVIKYSNVRNPFEIDGDNLPEDTASVDRLHEQLVDIQNDEKQKDSLSTFLIKMNKEKLLLGG